MIDLHSHILPGVDDGAATIDESVAIARAAADDGIRAIAATPHVRDDYPTTAAEMERLVGETRAAVDSAGIDVRVLTGGEIALEMLLELDDDELRRFGLGGNAGWLLLEFPYHGWPLALPEIVFDLRTRGFTPLLAHPERNAEVQADPARLAPLVGSGVHVQVTAASLDGRLGRRTHAAARRLLELDLVHVIASDAHAPEVREVGMRAAGDTVGDRRLARWLTEDVPAAIVAGERLPPRPQQQRKRRTFGLLRR
jgi:protein-tyrosine phosphatase